MIWTDRMWSQNTATEANGWDGCQNTTTLGAMVSSRWMVRWQLDDLGFLFSPATRLWETGSLACSAE